MAKNPLQLGQRKLLSLLCLYMRHVTWLKTLVFGQSRYRKFSGVSGCEAIMSASMRALQDHALDPRPPTDSCEDQRLVIGLQPLDQGHELAIEGQPAAFIRDWCRGGAVIEPRRRAPLQRRQR